MSAMRQILLAALSAVVAAVIYFVVLLDFVMPALQQRNLLVLWWCILGIYLILLFVFGSWSVIKAKPGMAALGFVLLLATAYCYDPTIQPHLETVHMGWLWVVFLIGLFFWIFLSQKYERKIDPRNPS